MTPLFSFLLLFFFADPTTPVRLTGLVHDAAGHPLPGAAVQLQSEATGARWRTTADSPDGRYNFADLPSGPYKLTVRLSGCRTASRTGLPLSGSGLQTLDVTLELIAPHETITVISQPDDLDPSSGGSLLLTRTSSARSPATLPANGRDFRALFDLLPGVVQTPAGLSDAGQFTANGQRPNANSFRVDGISVNTGVGSNSVPGAFPGASLPAMTAIGSTENLGSLDNTASIELRTANFAPEHGDRPGAETLIVTRSGTPDLHGSISNQHRDSALNAGDWFANRLRYPLTSPRFSNWSGNVSGPVWRTRRTFYFLSLDHSSLQDHGAQLTTVPSLQARQNAPPVLGNILSVYPAPIGNAFNATEAPGVTLTSTIASLGNASLRVDHSFGGRATLFGRYSYAPSSNIGSVNTNGSLHWRSLAVGLTLARSPWTHDLRFQNSRAISQGGFLGGLVGVLPIVAGFEPNMSVSVSPAGEVVYAELPVPSPLTLGLPYPKLSSIIALSIPHLGQFLQGWPLPAQQDQWELRETVARSLSRHQFRVGIDASRLTPSREQAFNTVRAVTPSLDGLLAATQPLAITVSQVPAYAGRIYNVNLFAQDTFALRESLTLVYGLRWELTPPTAGTVQPPTISGLWSGKDWQSVHTNNVAAAAPWPMRYTQLAPRLGLAWRLPHSRAVFRAGAGLFYDPALSSAVNPINGAPFNSWQLSANGTGIGASAPPASGIPVTPTLTPDVAGFLSGAAYPALQLPASHQWRASLETAIGAYGVGSLAYLGSRGQHLLGNQAYVEPATSVLLRSVTLTENASSYHALQARYTGTLAPRTNASVSYTWSHSIDNGSQDSAVFLIHPGYTLNEARASSSFDVRHALTAALTYETRPQLPRALREWTVSTITRARSGFPIDLYSGEPALGLRFVNTGRPDLVPGVPLWLSDPAVAGYRRLNPAAFAVPSASPTGTLGRNAISGIPLFQWDAGLHRDFPLTRTLRLDIGLTLFNVLNHPTFANPNPYLSSPLFGQSTSMQNVQFGSGSVNTGLPPQFQPGGSRSAECRFRISF